MWIVLLSCGGLDDTGTEGCFASSPVLEIGTGAQEYEALRAGDSVTMVHGPQGGWHMLGSVRLHNMDQIVEIHFTITDVDSGVVVSDNSYRVALVMDEECAGYFPGMYGYVFVDELEDGEADTPPELLAYHTVRMEMEAEDLSGRTASAQLDVLAVPDPVDVISEDTGAPK